jgi:transcriptional regulator with GAF, ATPase, and Fis domain
MPPAMQAKLLRVLEEGEVERIGSDKPTTVDVRVVVATHRNLEQLVESGGFRRDLYHRVVVFPVELPPLRQRTRRPARPGRALCRQVSAQNGWKPVPFTDAAIDALKQYAWPGNIRELRNVVERLLLLAAKALGLERSHLYKKCQQLGIDLQSLRSSE